MKLSRGEHLFWITCIAVITLFSTLLYLRINKRVNAGTGRIVGKLTFKLKSAQRKYAAGAVWEDLEQEVALYNHDAIRTADMSEAIITLNDKTKIRLDANSMIILNITDKAINIAYAYGSIQARRKGVSSAGELNIITSDNKIITIKDSDIKLTKTDGEKLNITTSRGEARIKIGDEEQVLKKDQVALLSKNKIEIRPLSLKLVAPPDNRRSFITGKTKRVNFSWNPVAKNPTVSLKISRSAGFQKIIVRRKLRGNQATTNLPSGIFYWHISAINPSTGIKETSAIRKIIISRNTAPVFRNPANKERIPYRSSAPLVHFSWSRNDFATGYQLEIARDRTFSNPVRLDSKTPGISTRLEAGKYFCRIKVIGYIPAASIESRVRSFSVVRIEKPAPPELLQPAAGRGFGRIIVQKQGIAFNWTIHRGLSRSEIWISRNSGFEPKIVRNLAGSFFTMRSALDEGKYFWKVRGLDTAGIPQTDFSRTSTFKIVKTAKLRLLSPNAGQEKSFFTARFQGIRFNWARLGLSGRYVFELSRSGDLSAPVAVKKISTVAISVPNLKLGSYYWRVSLLAADGSIVSRSNIRHFIIRNLMSRPELIYPREDSKIDMATRNALPLHWRKTRGADFYEVRLFQLFGNQRRTLLTKTTSSNSYVFTRLTALNKGNFGWSVKAIKKDGKNRISSKETVNRFQILLSREPRAEINPEKLFVK